MKHLMVPMVVSLACVSGSAVRSQEKPKLPPAATESKNPYYPLAIGSRWTYQATDNKAKGPALKQQVVIQATKREVYLFPVELKIGQPMLLPYQGYHLEVVRGKVALDEKVVVKENGVYRRSGAGKEIKPPLCILDIGVKTWDVKAQSENVVLEGTFETLEEAVQVPAGSYKALVVRSKDFEVSGQKMQTEAWYAAGVGMVKQRVRVGNHDVTLELEKYEPAP